MLSVPAGDRSHRVEGPDGVLGVAEVPDREHEVRAVELERGERDALITHPAAVLNELQQDGTVSALEIEVEAVGEAGEGAYRARGELVLADGSSERAEAERPSKRRARLAVMRELLEQLGS